jgi:hypothetical protein
MPPALRQLSHYCYAFLFISWKRKEKKRKGQKRKERKRKKETNAKKENKERYKVRQKETQ